MIQYLYIIFIGILFTILVAVGIAAFYPQPKYPEYPIELNTTVPPKEGTVEAMQIEKKSNFLRGENKGIPKNQ